MNGREMKLCIASFSLCLMTIGAAQAAAPTTGDATAGGAVFEDRCAFCHVEAGDGQGPSLKGLIGRKAASAPGFDFTPALKASGLTWTADTLDTFLANPGKAVPGTAMPIRVTDPEQRADLIAYFAKHR